ncbi:MAG: glycosyltransferase [Bacteroidia bacterium]|nr:MAG: glycosyltransferase [Bacteroidia bacterium]
MYMIPQNSLSITSLNYSTEGGAPVAILEAQATGLPVISSYHADVPPVVVDGKSALLAPEKDVGMLAKHLEYLVWHPDVWKRWDELDGSRSVM